MKELQVAEKTKEEETKEETPRSALAELLAGQLAPAAEIKEGENIPAGPKETVAPVDGTGLPFIDQLIATSQATGG